MRPRRRLVCALVLSASTAALVVGALSTPAGADPSPAAKPAPAGAKHVLFDRPPPAGFNSWQQVVVLQNQLNAAATKISAAAAKAGGDGLGSITADPLDRAVRVYWKGTMPASVRGLVGTLGQQTAIRVLPARYGEKELLREQAKLAGSSSAKQIAEVAPLPDASGLRLTMRAASVSSTTRGAEVRPAAPRRQVRLVVGYGGGPRPAADRYHDTNAFWGGAAFHSSSGVCSTGFAVFHSGRSKLLTAAHCGSNGTVFTTGDSAHTNNLTLGTMRNRNVFQDVGLIDPPAGFSTSGFVYTGAATSATSPFTSAAAMPVGSGEASFIGNLVFGSGARSGYVSTMTVQAKNVSGNQGTAQNPVIVFPLVKAERTDFGSAGGSGDSGGPIGWFSNDLSHVVAKGTYSASGPKETFVTCTGVPGVSDPDAVGRHCSYDVYYVQITDSISLYSASLLVN